MSTKPFFKRVALCAPVLALLGVAEPAAACGGFFCSSAPVDQTAEHIIFTINGDHTVTAYVQIAYAGDPDKFAWIIPAPSAPALSADFPDLAMRALDLATQPQYFKRSCAPVYAAPGGGTGGSGGASGVDAGVTVIAHQNVGPFETVTLEGTSASLLVDWLQKNGYRITDKMIPFIQPYVEGGMKFVAMRLLPDKGTKDITPLGMKYDSDKPAIPLRLTTVAAQPEMGIVTWILSNKRWAPDNYVDLKIADSLIQFNQYGYQSNYLTVVSREVDKVGGQAFVTEYAKGTGDLLQQIQNQFLPSFNPNAAPARDALVGLLSQYTYITRLYTRMSAEEMTEDPTFKVSSHQEDVTNIHDLTDPNFNYSQCTVPPPPNDVCAFTYCGRSGVCAPALTAGLSVVPACVCAPTAAGRATSTSGSPSVYCEPLKMDLDALDSDAGTAALFVSACEGVTCSGHGKCTAINGNPTCQCDPGYGATATATYDPNTGTSSTTLGCEFVGPFVPALPALPPIGQAPSGSPGSGGTAGAGGSSGSSQVSCGISAAQGPGASFLVWLAGAAGAVGVIARRRRR